MPDKLAQGFTTAFDAVERGVPEARDLLAHGFNQLGEVGTRLGANLAGVGQALSPALDTAVGAIGATAEGIASNPTVQTVLGTTIGQVLGAAAPVAAITVGIKSFLDDDDEAADGGKVPGFAGGIGGTGQGLTTGQESSLEELQAKFPGLSREGAMVMLGISSGGPAEVAQEGEIRAGPGGIVSSLLGGSGDEEQEEEEVKRHKISFGGDIGDEEEEDDALPKFQGGMAPQQPQPQQQVGIRGLLEHLQLTELDPGLEDPEDIRVPISVRDGGVERGRGLNPGFAAGLIAVQGVKSGLEILQDAGLNEGGLRERRIPGKEGKETKKAGKSTSKAAKEIERAGRRIRRGGGGRPIGVLPPFTDTKARRASIKFADGGRAGRGLRRAG